MNKTKILLSMVPDIADLLCALTAILLLCIYHYVILFPIDCFVGWFMNNPRK